MPKTDLTPANRAAIENARAFTVQILAGREFKKVGRPTLATARAWAPVMENEAGNGRRAMIHAIADGRAIFVPASYQPDAKVEAKPIEPVKPKAEKPKAPAKAKAAKPAKAKPAAKPRAEGPSKSDIAVRLLTRRGGAARKDIVAACGGWGVDLRQLCGRRGLKLKRLADGNFVAS